MPKAKAALKTDALLKDVLEAFPVDTAAFEEALKSGAALNDKLSALTLTTAEKSADISAAWTRETLASLGAVTKAQAEPAGYMQELSAFATAQASAATDNMTALSDVLRGAQEEAMALLQAAAESYSKDASAFVSKTTEDMQKMATKLAPAA